MYHREKLIKAWHQTPSTKSNEIFIGSSHDPYDTFQAIYDIPYAILSRRSSLECSSYENEKVGFVSHI